MRKLMMIAMMGLIAMMVGWAEVMAENEKERAAEKIAEVEGELAEFKREIERTELREKPLRLMGLIKGAEEHLSIAKKDFEQEDFDGVFFWLESCRRIIQKSREKAIDEDKRERRDKEKAAEKIAKVEQELDEFKGELEEKAKLVRIPKYVNWIPDIRWNVRRAEGILANAKQHFREGQYQIALSGAEWVKGEVQENRERLEKMPYLKIDFVAVEWKPVTLNPKLYLAIPGIFVEPGGIVRVVDIHPKHLRGQRLWVSRDWGKTWRLEKQIADAWANKDWLQTEVGPEAAKLFEERGGGPLCQWPKETREWGEKTGYGSGTGTIVFNRCPIYPGRLILSVTTIRGQDMRHIARLFVSLNSGRKWVEISVPSPIIGLRPGEEGLQQIDIESLTITTDKNKVILFAGQYGRGMIVQKAVIKTDELERFF